MIFCVPKEHLDNLVRTGNDVTENPLLSVIEECGELITAISKFEANRIDYDFGIDRITEELTHVLVSISLLCRQLGIDQSNVRTEIMSKAVKSGWDISSYDWSK